MTAGVPKRSIVVRGRKTSVSLEDAFWRDLGAIARSKHTSISGLINHIDEVRRPESNLSSAVRVFILDHYRQRYDGQARSVQDEPPTAGALTP